MQVGAFDEVIRERTTSAAHRRNTQLCSRRMLARSCDRSRRIVVRREHDAELATRRGAVQEVEKLGGMEAALRPVFRKRRLPQQLWKR